MLRNEEDVITKIEKGRSFNKTSSFLIMIKCGGGYYFFLKDEFKSSRSSGIKMRTAVIIKMPATIIKIGFQIGVISLLAISFALSWCSSAR